MERLSSSPPAATCWACSLRWACRTSVRSVWRALPRQDRRLVLLDPLLDDDHGLDAVKPARVLPEQLALSGDRHVELRHLVQTVPGILGVVVRIIGRPNADVLEHVPETIDERLVGLEADEAPLVEDLHG